MGHSEWYQNDKPIILSSYDYTKELSKLDCNSFPLIEDFEIITIDTGEYMGIHVYFFSQTIGKMIASFPWWDHADKNLKEMDISSIPLGKVRSPYNDLEQSWQILIWEERDNVYIMQGDEPCCVQFPIWFKVKKQKYMEEWVKLIEKYKQIQIYRKV